MIEEIVVGGAVAAITAVCGFAVWVVKRSSKRHAESKEEVTKTRELMRSTMLSLVRQEIVDAVKGACETGHFTVESYEALVELVISYRELGGNGTIEHMVRRIDERLEIEKGINDG